MRSATPGGASSLMCDARGAAWESAATVPRHVECPGQADRPTGSSIKELLANIYIQKASGGAHPLHGEFVDLKMKKSALAGALPVGDAGTAAFPRGSGRAARTKGCSVYRPRTLFSVELTFSQESERCHYSYQCRAPAQSVAKSATRPAAAKGEMCTQMS